MYAQLHSKAKLGLWSLVYQRAGVLKQIEKISERINSKDRTGGEGKGQEENTRFL